MRPLVRRRESSGRDPSLRALAAAVILRARKDYMAKVMPKGSHGLKMLSWEICRHNDFETPQDDVDAFMISEDFEFWVVDVLELDAKMVQHWIRTGEGPGPSSETKKLHPHTRKR